MENERPPLLRPPDHAELSSTRENCAGFLALLGSDASNPGRSKNCDGIQSYLVGGLPRALRSLGALVGADKALIGRYFGHRLTCYRGHAGRPD